MHSSLFVDLRTTARYLLNHQLCRLLRRLRARAPAKPDYSDIYTSPEYSCETNGDCNAGSYIEVYRPDNPFLGDNGRPKAVIFLHGFALGASQIYRAHLKHLVQQGYWVFYPNYQTGFCNFPDTPYQTVAELIDEVFGDGLIPSQERWLRNALSSVSAAFDQAGFGDGTAVDTYVYGHSLGGLFALSWPHYVECDGLSSNLLPLQVLAADPVPSTDDSRLPGKLGELLKALTDPVELSVTGKSLKVPVAILHGNDDWVAPKDHWDKPFGCIASDHKRMYLSFTDTHGCDGLYANHEQSTTDTSFFPPLLALSILDGVGSEDNLDWRYLWYALDRIIRDGERADQLLFNLGSWSDGKPVHKIEIYLPAEDRG